MGLILIDRKQVLKALLGVGRDGVRLVFGRIALVTSRLLRNSDEVLATMLSLSGRGELKIGAGLQETRETFLQLLGAFDALLGASGAEAGGNE